MKDDRRPSKSFSAICYYVVVMPLATSSFLLLVVRHLATSSFLLLVAMPLATSSFLFSGLLCHL